jgi:hypothetical protein
MDIIRDVINAYDSTFCNLSAYVCDCNFIFKIGCDNNQLSREGSQQPNGRQPPTPIISGHSPTDVTHHMTRKENYSYNRC